MVVDENNQDEGDEFDRAYENVENWTEHLDYRKTPPVPYWDWNDAEEFDTARITTWCPPSIKFSEGADVYGAEGCPDPPPEVEGQSEFPAEGTAWSSESNSYVDSCITYDCGIGPSSMRRDRSTIARLQRYSYYNLSEDAENIACEGGICSEEQCCTSIPSNESLEAEDGDDMKRWETLYAGQYNGGWGGVEQDDDSRWKVFGEFCPVGENEERLSCGNGKCMYGISGTARGTTTCLCDEGWYSGTEENDSAPICNARAESRISILNQSVAEQQRVQSPCPVSGVPPPGQSCENGGICIVYPGGMDGQGGALGGDVMMYADWPESSRSEEDDHRCLCGEYRSDDHPDVVSNWEGDFCQDRPVIYRGSIWDMDEEFGIEDECIAIDLSNTADVAFCADVRAPISVDESLSASDEDRRQACNNAGACEDPSKITEETCIAARCDGNPCVWQTRRKCVYVMDGSGSSSSDSENCILPELPPTPDSSGSALLPSDASIFDPKNYNIKSWEEIECNLPYARSSSLPTTECINLKYSGYETDDAVFCDGIPRQATSSQCPEGTTETTFVPGTHVPDLDVWSWWDPRDDPPQNMCNGRACISYRGTDPRFCPVSRYSNTSLCYEGENCQNKCCTLCDTDYHVSEGDCIQCDAGSHKIAGDDPSGNDTNCLCNENYHVSEGKCIPCPDDSTNAADDDPSTGDTNCFCPQDWRAEDSKCVPCEEGTTNDAGDNPLEDSDCDGMSTNTEIILIFVGISALVLLGIGFVAMKRNKKGTSAAEIGGSE
jgi:hypothetical protein